MSYEETVQWLFDRLPMYQRVGKAAYKANLDNTLALDKHLGSPHLKFKTIHVAGTNGKGSTSHFLASILQEAGLKTGLYTSPHLKDYRERIKINGEYISKDFVQSFVEDNQLIIEELQPSFFELTVAMAFQYFANQKVDVAVIEVGMGGRLDSTNIITPELSIITNIGWDHMQFLGDHLPAIAKEKAGIIKKNIPIVIGEYNDETIDVFQSKARNENAEIHLASEKYKIELEAFDAKSMSCPLLINGLSQGWQTPLTGKYQEKNLATVFTSVDVLKKKGFVIETNHIRNGIKNVIKNTGLMGRWQIVNLQPFTVYDTAHNSDGLQYTISQMKGLNSTQLHFVLGFVNDKEIDKLIQLFPVEGKFYYCNFDSLRALNPEHVNDVAAKYGRSGTIYESVAQALEHAKSNSKPEDAIYVGGSTFVVADIVS